MVVEGPRIDGSQGVIISEDAASQTAYGVYQDYLSFGAVTSVRLDPALVGYDTGPDILLDLAQAHIAARKAPREVVQLTPFPLLSPRFAIDWHIGDIVTVRVVVEDQVQVDGQARIWGADVAIDELGNEVPTLQLVPE
jgi:hypothetical protein